MTGSQERTEHAPVNWHDGLTKLRGVFEGGGAKGVAYEGALRALANEGYWFEGVAGASAGALAAVLVAAGLQPDEFRPAMRAILQSVRGTPQPTSAKSLAVSLLRVRRQGALIDRRAFVECIDDFLRRRVRGDHDADARVPPEDTLPEIVAAQSKGVRVGCDRPTPSVTFAELFDRFRIDLCVVAVDISRQQPIVFSHSTTPHCQVADAVVASCSIPLVFEGERLYHAPRPGGWSPVFSTVVDGGVWTNFPVFVWEDVAFRKWAGLGPLETTSRTIGFVLSATASDPLEPTMEELAHQWRAHASFAPWFADSLCPIEAAPPSLVHRLGRRKGEATSPQETGFDSSRNGTAWSVLPSMAQWLVDRLIDKDLLKDHGPPRWPTPRSRARARAARLLDNALLAVYASRSGYLAIVLLVAMVAGPLQLFTLCARVAREQLLAYDTIHSITYQVLAHLGWVLLVVGLLGCVVALSLAVGATLVAVACPWLLLKPIRHQAWGLISTYFANPAAPPWVAQRPDVIELPIGHGVSTLTFDLEETTQLSAVVVDAEEATRLGIRRMRASDHLPRSRS